MYEKKPVEKAPHLETDKEILGGFDPNGRRCEFCENDMASHDWVLMNEHGFVLFCSNYQWRYESLKQDIASTINELWNRT